ncbi:MAG: serine/threonine-protein kinase [Pirellulaceae bacterium]
MSRETDADLLFGLLAVQTEFIDRAKLREALAAWSQDKRRTLSEVLCAQGSIDSAEQSLLEQIVQRKIDSHRGDASASLDDTAALAFLRDELTSLGDKDIDRTLSRHPGGDFDSLATQVPGDTPAFATTSPGTLAHGGETVFDAPGDGASFSDQMRFTPIRKHAEGGLGEVSIAADRELKREVALKEIKSRFADDVASRRRFVLEGEITGALEHPGVVPVYGMGAHADGRPYYAMRFIRGESLREAINAFHKNAELAANPGQRLLALQKLLRRFIDACHTMQYAHSRGVLHRDLKPDNIMLGPYGETLVIDWGLARLFNRGDEVRESVDERSLHPDAHSPIDGTAQGRVVGTLQYMSPEQALGWHQRLTPASDVFALGAILYSILTGQPPIAGATFDQLHEKALAAEFPPPRAVNDRVPRALEAICTKAMAKSTADRYADAGQLADDIEAYLAGEPVSAWDEPFTVRAARWMRRHRTFVVAGLATLGVSLAALVVVVAVLGTKNAEIAAQRDVAEQNLVAARGAVRESLIRIAEDERLKAQGLEQLRLDLLKAPEPYYAKFLAQSPDDPALRFEQAEWLLLLATVDYDTGRRREAAERYRRAEQITAALAKEFPAERRYQAALAKARTHLGQVALDLGQYTEAEAALGAALETALAVSGGGRANEASGGEVEDDANAQLSRIYFLQGRLAERQGLLLLVEPLYEQAVEAQLRVVQAYPDQAEALIALTPRQNALAQWLEQVGEYDQAEKLYRDTLARLKEIEPRAADPDRVRLSRGVTLDLLGMLQNGVGRPRAALETMDEAVALLHDLSLAHPDHLHYQEVYAQALHDANLPLSAVGKIDAVLEAEQQMLAMHESLAAEHPEVVEYRSLLATSHLNLADNYLFKADAERAGEHYAAASELAAALHQEFPDDPTLALMDGVLQQRRAAMLANRGKPEEALAAISAAIDDLTALSDKTDLIRVRSYLADAHYSLATLYQAQGKYDLALQSIDTAHEIYAGLPPSAWRLPRLRMYYSTMHLSAAHIHHAAGHGPEKVVEEGQRTLELRQQLVEEVPDEPIYLARLAHIHAGFGVWQLETYGEAGIPAALQHLRAALDAIDGIDLKWLTADELLPIMQSHTLLAQQHEQAEEHQQARERYEAAARFCRAIHEKSGRSDILIAAAQSEINAGSMLVELGELEAALAAFDAGRATAEQVLLDEPQNEDARDERAAAFCRRAEALRDEGRHREALQAWDQAVEVGSTYYAVYARTERAGEYAQLGQHLTAVEQIKLAMQRGDVDATDLYNAACVYGIATSALQEDETIAPEERKRLADWYADGALTYLRKARDAGFFDLPEDLQHFLDNEAFTPLRDRDAFKSFTAEVEAGRSEVKR